MKQITKYQSNDSKVFDTPEEATKRDLEYKLELLCEGGSYHINNHTEDVAEFILENFAEIKKIIETE